MCLFFITRVNVPVKMKKTPLFIHSLFRTGSTYIWHKFRQQKEYYCYYEPFNQFLSDISLQRPYIWSHESKAAAKVRHPEMTQNQLFEYKKCLKPGQTGVPFFKKSFSFDDYCNNASDPDKKRYIDNLIQAAEDEGKRAVLQFNRSALRIGWFKTYFPDSINIYLIRNPRNQWQSYISMAEEQHLDIFLIMDLLITGKNKNTQYFKNLSPYIYLLEFNSDRFQDEERVYRTLLDVYSYDELYFIFYFIWFTALWENVCHADILLAIDLLISDKCYAERIVEALEKKSITGINLSDVTPRSYREYKLETKKMAEIEQQVKAIIFQGHGREESNYFLNILSEKEKEFFNLSEECLPPPNSVSFKPQSKDEIIKKQEAILQKLLGLNSKLENDRSELVQVKQALQRVKNSYSYKLGRLLLFPFRMIKRIFKRR